MALPCPFDISLAQPQLVGCPPSDSYVMFISTSGSIPNGIGFASWATIQNCLGGSIMGAFVQFVVGQPNAPMVNGQIALVVNQANVITDSVWISFGSNELPRNTQYILPQVAYTVQYATPSSTQMTITFDSPVATGELYIIHYLYFSATLSPITLPPSILNFRVGDGGINTPIAGSNVYNPSVNPLVGRTVVLVFQGNILVSPSPTESAGDINWSFVSLTGTLTLANGEFDNNTPYTIVYQ